MEALIDSGCMRTCIDEEFIRSQGFMMTKILEPIKVEYADRTVVEGSTIRYTTNLKIWAASATIVTGALVTRLKSAKVFLGFDWLQAVNPRIDWKGLQVEVNKSTVPLQMRSIEETPDYSELYKRVFSEEVFQGLPPWRKWDHQINLLLEHSPLWGRCYPLAAREKEALREFIEVKLKSGKIKRSDSPYASPFFFRPKPGTGELWGIQDYRHLNKITIKDRYPLLLIQEVLGQAQGSRVLLSVVIPPLSSWTHALASCRYSSDL
jgi:hypothetical protein